jgi:signal peptidase I
MSKSLGGKKLDEIAYKKSQLREWGESIVIALILAMFIRTFVIQAFKIPSGSMIPTLLIGDHLLVSKFVYGIRLPLIGKTIFKFKDPQRGDVIVFICPVDRSKDFIKRVIGLPGDKIEIINKKVYINGKLYADPHAYYSDPHILPKDVSPRDNFGPIVVPPHKYFVMGDNRDSSWDSRFWGFVDRNDILGKALIIYWSWERPFYNIRWRRIGMIIR